MHSCCRSCSTRLPCDSKSSVQRPESCCPVPNRPCPSYRRPWRVDTRFPPSFLRPRRTVDSGCGALGLFVLAFFGTPKVEPLRLSSPPVVDPQPVSPSPAPAVSLKTFSEEVDLSENDVGVSHGVTIKTGSIGVSEGRGLKQSQVRRTNKGTAAACRREVR
jgi:hypothetical protein